MAEVNEMPLQSVLAFDVSHEVDQGRRLHLEGEADVDQTQVLQKKQHQDRDVVAVYGSPDSRSFRIFYSELAHKRYLRHRRNQLIAAVLIAGLISFNSPSLFSLLEPALTFLGR